MDAAAAAAGWFVHLAIDKYMGKKLEQWASRAGLLEDFRHLKNQSSMARATLTVVDWRRSLPNDALVVLIKEIQLAAIDVDQVLGEMDCCRLTEFVGSTGGALRRVLRRSAGLFSSPFKRANTGAAGGREGLGHGAVVAPPFVLQLEEISARTKSASARLEDAASMVRRIVKLEQSVLTTRLLLQLEEASLCQACSSLIDPKVLHVLGRDEDASDSSINPHSRAGGSFKARALLSGAKRKRARESCSGAAGRADPRAGCTIPEVMELVCQAGAEIGSDEHFLATQLFVKLEFREMFLTLKEPEHRIAWLTRMWNERKGGQ